MTDVENENVVEVMGEIGHGELPLLNVADESSSNVADPAFQSENEPLITMDPDVELPGKPEHPLTGDPEPGHEEPFVADDANTIVVTQENEALISCDGRHFAILRLLFIC